MSTAAVLEREGVGTRVRVTVFDRPEWNRTVDPRSAAEVAEARAQFAELKHLGYFCYREEDGGSGTILRAFEPETDVTYVPRMVGG